MTFPDPANFINGLDTIIYTRTGQPLYLNPYQGSYTTSRSYGLRMQRNYRRGLQQATARGHPTVGGVTEAQTRRQREQAKYQDTLSPSERNAINFQNRYGFSYNYWRRLRRLWVDEINARALPNPRQRRMMVDNGVRKDPRVFPDDIKYVMDLYNTGFRDPLYSWPAVATWEAWAELRLGERLTALIDYQDFGDKSFGRNAYDSRSGTWLRQPGLQQEDLAEQTGVWLSYNMLGGSAAGPTIELWWYH